MMKDNDVAETTITTATTTTSSSMMMMMMIPTRRKRSNTINRESSTAAAVSLSPVSIIIFICFGLILSCLISIRTNHRSAILISSTESLVEQYTHQHPMQITTSTTRTAAIARASVSRKIDSSSTVGKYTTHRNPTSTTRTTAAAISSSVSSRKIIDSTSTVVGKSSIRLTAKRIDNNNKEIKKESILFEKKSISTAKKAEEEATVVTPKINTSNNNTSSRYSYLRKFLRSNNKTKAIIPPLSISKIKKTTTTNCRLEEGNGGGKDETSCEEESSSEEDDPETKNTTTTFDFDYDNVHQHHPPHRNGKWAYAYVISGCTETSCNGYILNIIVSSWVLHHHGGSSKYNKSKKSKADIVVKIRMAAATNTNSNVTKLDPNYENMLHKCNIKFDYLPKVKYDNFGTATLEKFRVLEMIQYERVLFLDADIIPLCNMDYMFEQSYGENNENNGNENGGLLSEYVAISGSAAPATASIFLVTPKLGEFGRIMDIVKRHHQRLIEPYIFYPSVGWGHQIHHNDKWKEWWKTGTEWDFYAAPSDQGILYHWMKYQQLNYTQIVWSTIQQYREVKIHFNNTSEINTTIFEVPDYSGQYNGQIRYIKMINETFNTRKETTLPSCGGKRWGRGGYSTIAPFADYYHFKGNTKPWKKSTISLKKTSDKALRKLSNKHDPTAGEKAWQIWLAQANKALDLGLPIRFRLESITKSGNPLGLLDNGTDLFSPNIELPQPLLL